LEDFDPVAEVLEEAIEGIKYVTLAPAWNGPSGEILADG
jgi:hypothetical protein